MKEKIWKICISSQHYSCGEPSGGSTAPRGQRDPDSASLAGLPPPAGPGPVLGGGGVTRLEPAPLGANSTPRGYRSGAEASNTLIRVFFLFLCRLKVTFVYK